MSKVTLRTRGALEPWGRPTLEIDRWLKEGDRGLLRRVVWTPSALE